MSAFCGIWPKIGRRTAVLLLSLPAFASLAAQVCLFLRSPPAWLPATIELNLAPGRALTLGRHEIAAQDADETHLRVSRDAGGVWRVSNISESKQVLLTGPDGERRVRSAMLEIGAAFDLRSHGFRVLANDDGVRLAESSGGEWRYDGYFLWRDGDRIPACPDASFRTWAAEAWNRMAMARWRSVRPLRLGGGVLWKSASAGRSGARQRFHRH